MTRAHLVLLACVATSAAALSGCTHVSPYQREYLARPGMDVEEREQMRGQFTGHVFEAREAAMPSSEHAGGGCGCN